MAPCGTFSLWVAPGVFCVFGVPIVLGCMAVMSGICSWCMCEGRVFYFSYLYKVKSLLNSLANFVFYHIINTFL